MTGAGAADVAWAPETDFLDGVGADPTWRSPGFEIESAEPTLERQLRRKRRPDTPQPAGSREGNIRGSFNLTHDLTDDHFHEFVFPENSNTELPTGAQRAPSVVWYISADLLGDDIDRFLLGSIENSVSWNYQQGQDITVDHTIAYADEIEAGDEGAPDVPTSIETPDKSDVVTWHDMDWEIDSASVEKLQSLTLTISNLYRLQYGQSEIAVDAVTAGIEPTLTAEAILSDKRQYELALGGVDATSTQTRVDETDTTLSFDGVSDLSVNGVQPDNSTWNEVASVEDITDPTEYHVSEVSVN